MCHTMRAIEEYYFRMPIAQCLPSAIKNTYSNFANIMCIFITSTGQRTNRNRERNRIEVRVFRGANNEVDNFAPWGYVIRQPADRYSR